MSLNQPALAQPPLAVVGLSALFPKADSLDQFWSNIRRGVDAITEVPATHWNPDDYFDANQKTPDMTYARRGGFLSPVPFDPLEYGISPNNLEAIDTSQLLGLVGAKRALEHAGYGAGRQFDRSRVGCILGVTGTLEMVIPLGARLGHPRWKKALKDAGVPDDVAADVVQRISESYVPWQENSFPGLLGNVVAGRIANRLDLHGTNCVVDAACASSLSAIHLASLELWTGRSDMVVTGGIDTFNDIFMFMCFSKTPALSPSGDAKPFSEAADGTILGEGTGIVVLKRLADAERDGDRIYAVLKGIGTSSDGAGSAVYAPKAEGQVRCLQDAYKVAGISPDTVELVEAHGTGTKVGDATEVSGLMQVYQATGRRGPWCAVGSIKSQIGHTKAAAGAAGIIKAILALQHRVLPPTIKVSQPPAAILVEGSPFYVNIEARPWVKPNGYPRRAAVSAFGFGGSNFHCVLEESPQNFETPDWDGDVQIVALSAESQPQLVSQLQAWSQVGDWAATRTRATATRATFQPTHAHRLLFVVERDKTDLAKIVAGAITMLEKYADRADWSTPDGAYYGRGAAAGRLGVLFPGQGSQYIGMLRELACRFPAMNDVLSEANEVFASRVESGPFRAMNKLTDFVYPAPAWSQGDRDAQDDDLRATQVAQPAIGAVSLGALAILEQFGVHPEAAAGHSYGELTALCASRRFAPKTLYRLSMLRGRLMAEAQEVDGGMLAVGAPLTQVEAAIKEMAVDLVVANYNSPNQIVLSGRIPEIDRASALFSQRNLRGKKLQVAAAFHSPLVATASRAFRPELEVVEFAPSQMPVYANSTGAEYPADATAARDLLASQLARPVNFVHEIEQMYADGVRTFLEVGPGGVLTGLVNSILSGREFRAIAVDSSNGRRGGVFDLAHTLAQLSASGRALRLDAWDPQASAVEATSSRLRIPICGANYVKPRTPLPPRPPMVVPAAQMPVAPPPTQNQPQTNGQLQQPLVSPVAPSPARDISLPLPLPAALPVPPAMTSPDVPRREENALSPRAIATVQQHLQTLKQMQEETARIHQRFLESQEAALRTFEELSRRQLELTLGNSAPKPAAPRASFETPVVAAAAQRPFIPLPSDVAPAMKPPVAPPAAPQPVLSTQYSVLSTTVPVALLATPPAPITSAAVTSLPAPSAPLKGPALPAEPPAPAVTSALSTTVLAVVSEKTGYPTEMLSLGMSLDHDLGIDSIKRVEILSALQERVANLPAFKPDELGSLHTLGDVVALAEARSAASGTSPTNATLLSSAAAPQPVQGTQYSVLSVPATTSVSAAGPALSATVLAVVSEKTGYPTEMLNLGMSLDHDLGIDSIKRVEILSALQERVANLPAFKPDELGSLHTLGDVVALAEARSAASGTADSPVPAVVQVAAPVSTVTAPQPVFSTPYSVPSTPGNAIAGPSLSATVLAVVSEKTGYPTEMLNLGMSLDHDLGIDSIKRVEILSALQERVANLPAFKPDELGSLHTLGDVVTLAEARSAANGIGVSSVSQSVPDSVPALSSVAAPQPVLSTQYSVSSMSVNAIAGPSLSATVLAVVSEKTGYPTEMLNLGMSLDHDLGIDSIKRVEILSALQERVANLPAFKPDELGSLHTLGDVVTLAEARSAANGAAGSPMLQPALAAPVGLSSGAGSQPVLSNQYSGSPSSAGQPLTQPSTLVRSIVRSESLPPLPELPIVRGGEVWVTDDGLGLSLQIAAELTKRGLKPRLIQLDEPGATTAPAQLAGLIVIAHAEGTQDRHLWRAIELLQKAGPALRQAAKAGASVFATVAHLNGRFGFEAQQALTDPLSGGLAGLAKSAAREWPDVTCKAIDVSSDWGSTNDAAVQIVDQLFRKGPVEVGLSPRGATTPTVVEQSLSTFSTSASAIQPGDLVIVSGGARGVTAEAAVAAVQQWKCRLAILGRSPEPAAEPEWLRVASSDAEIKQGLIRNLPKGTLPKEIESQFRQVLAGREVTTTLNRLRALGAPVEYHAVDIRDLAAVRLLLVQLQNQHGPIRGVIHGAGVLADQRIEDKTREQFDRVYQTKVTGLRNVLGAIRHDQLRVLCLFSSYTARYGRVGQCDYAMANEVLNKLARQFSIENRQCHVVSFNWGPWDGGMVTGGLKKLFAAEQVGLIPLADGAKLVVQELSQTGSWPVEVLVLGKTDAPATAPSIPQPTPTASAAVVSEPSSELKIAFEKSIDVQQSPYLESHVIGGKAVVPVAIILEWLAHGAIHHNPGLELEGFDDFRVFHGVRMDRNDKLLLRVMVGKPIRVGTRFTIRTQLIGSNGGRETIHAAGNVILSAQLPTNPQPQPQLQVTRHSYSHEMTTAYATKLFHGPHLQGIAAVEACSPDGIIVASRTSPAPWAWMHDPFRSAWLADPLSIDGALQAVILWTQEQRGMPCLPCAIGSYRQFRKVFPTSGIKIVVKVTQATEHTIRADIEFLDIQGALVAQMTGCESVADASLANAFSQNRLA
ncbi:MAG: Erythronolide synthase [Schlesneria sp.]|nr:Erythronolide synthase [Schlesneria sp.]